MAVKKTKTNEVEYYQDVLKNIDPLKLFKKHINYISSMDYIRHPVYKVSELNANNINNDTRLVGSTETVKEKEEMLTMLLTANYNAASLEADQLVTRIRTLNYLDTIKVDITNGISKEIRTRYLDGKEILTGLELLALITKIDVVLTGVEADLLEIDSLTKLDIDSGYIYSNKSSAMLVEQNKELTSLKISLIGYLGELSYE